MQFYKFVFSLVPQGAEPPASWIDDTECKQFYQVPINGDIDASWEQIRGIAAVEFPGYTVHPWHVSPHPV